METDLSDGLKLLILQEGRFWPARLNSTQLPDVYGIVMEKQRGNRPQILPRDDILKEAVRFLFLIFLVLLKIRAIILFQKNFFSRFLKSNQRIKDKSLLVLESVFIGAELTTVCFLEL